VPAGTVKGMELESSGSVGVGNGTESDDGG